MDLVPGAGAPASATAYVLDGTGVLAAVNLTTFRTTRVIPTGPAPIELALAPDGQTVYVLDGSPGVLLAIDLRTRRASARSP